MVLIQVNKKAGIKSQLKISFEMKAKYLLTYLGNMKTIRSGKGFWLVDTLGKQKLR